MYLYFFLKLFFIIDTQEKKKDDRDIKKMQSFYKKDCNRLHIRHLYKVKKKREIKTKAIKYKPTYTCCFISQIIFFVNPDDSSVEDHELLNYGTLFYTRRKIYADPAFLLLNGLCTPAPEYKDDSRNNKFP